MGKTIQPIGKRVLIKRVNEDEKSSGGIIIPDSAKEKPQEAEIISLGCGTDEKGNEIQFSVKVGDRVLISKYGGTEVKLDGVEYLIIGEDDVLGIIQK